MLMQYRTSVILKNMGKPKLTTQAKVAKLRGELKLLQQKDYLRITDIHDWLSENINDTCQLVKGIRGRSLRSTGMLSCELVEQKGRLLGLADGYWAYGGKRQRGPDLLSISNFFDGLTFIEAIDETVAEQLKTKLVLDMAKWPTVIDMMLYTHALSVFIFQESDEDKKQRDVAKIELILKHTYPHMSMTQLNVAYDIGLIHDQSSLYDWLKEMRVPQVSTAIAPPDNLAL